MMTNAITPAKDYAVGVISSVGFGSQVHTVSTDSMNGSGVARIGDGFIESIPWFIDGQGNAEEYRAHDLYPDHGVVKLTLTDTTTGTQIFTTDNSDPDSPGFFVVPGLDPATHTYRLDETTTSKTPEWELSTKVTSSWTWQSQTTPQTGDTLVNEPMRDVWYELPGLDAYNYGSESQPIVLHVGQQVDSVPLKATNVSLQATTDGKTWVEVPVQAGSTGPDGTTLYAGTIDAPVDATVSLRASITGDNSSLAQTITDAYVVTDDPQTATKVTWADDCPVPPTTEPSEPSEPTEKTPKKIGTGGTVIPRWTPYVIIESIQRWLTAG